MLRVGLWGLGFIASSHVAAYDALSKQGYGVRFAAACDIDASAPQQIKREKDSESFNFYTDIETMLENEDLDMIDICLPTHEHVSAATDMLKRMYHVLLEKPMGFNIRQCAQLQQLAANTGKVFMVGQCLRFYQPYVYLKSLIETQKYGKVLSAYFERLSMTPQRTGDNWLLDVNKSGGCLFDVHIHDVDMVRFLFGEPSAVSSSALDVYSGYDAVSTRFVYPDMLVHAIADWTMTPAFCFRPSFRISFQNADVLFENYQLIIYEKNNRIEPALDYTNGITHEIQYFIELIQGKKNTVNPPRETVKTIALLEAIKSSADENGKLVDFGENYGGVL